MARGSFDGHKGKRMSSRVWDVNHFDRRRGVPGGIRTPNLLIRSQLLYPVELQTPVDRR